MAKLDDDMLYKIDLWASHQIAGTEDMVYMSMLGYTSTILARAIADIPGTRCNKCNLHPGYVFDIAGNRVTCKQCNGTGRIDFRKQNAKIAPSLIHAQGARGSKDDWRGDIVARVDLVYCSMPKDVQIVFFSEHVPMLGKRRLPTQQERAAQLGIDQPGYSRKLSEAYDMLLAEFRGGQKSQRSIEKAKL